MKTIYARATAFFGTILLGGCAPQAPSDEDIVSVSSADVYPNGVHQNGLRSNRTMDGMHINVNGTSLNGLPVSGMALEGTVFTGSVGGATVSGDAFVGATMTAHIVGGGALPLRIDTIESSPDPEILLYGVSAFSGTKWEPLCTDEVGHAVRAFPLQGFWDEKQGTPTGGAHFNLAGEITFACQGYAIAKCAQIGYKPWKTVQECLTPNLCHEVPLAALHQACTRMMRADYCGNGVPTTRDGTLIDVADQMGLESPAGLPGWRFEAEWGEDGANCVETTRWATLPPDGGRDRALPTRTYIKEYCPERWASANSSCGTAQSTFFVGQGFTAPLDERSLLTTRIAGPKP